jgi:hypothetical protein
MHLENEIWILKGREGKALQELGKAIIREDELQEKLKAETLSKETAWDSRAKVARELSNSLNLLKRLRSVFLSYEKIHKKKGTPEGDLKAVENKKIANEITSFFRDLGLDRF